MVSIVSVVSQTSVQDFQYFTNEYVFISTAVLFKQMFVSVQSVMDVYGFV